MSYKQLPISEEVKTLLDTLCERKIEINQLNKRKTSWTYLTMGLGFLFLYLFVQQVLIPAQNDVLKILSLSIDFKLGIFLLILFITTQFMAKQYKEKEAKAKKGFEELRIELIGRLNSSWLKNKESKLKDTIATEMKEKHGINLMSKS